MDKVRYQLRDLNRSKSHDYDHLLTSLDQEIDKRSLMLQAVIGDRFEEFLDLTGSLVDMQTSCDNIQSISQDIKLKAKEFDESKPLPTKSNNIDPIPAIAKIVHDGPENIWKLIESEHYLYAAWLYSFARVTHAHLSETYSDTLSQLVILKSQHENTVQLKTQIVLKANVSLIKQKITVDDALQTLTCLIILDSPSFDHSLQKFLNQKSITIQQITKSDSIQIIIQQFIQVVNETTHISEQLFSRGQLNDFINDCRDISNSTFTTKGLIQLLPDAPIILHRTPNQLLNFAPYFTPVEKMDESKANLLINEWTMNNIDVLKNIIDPESGHLSKIDKIVDLCPLRATVEVSNIGSVKEFFIKALNQRFSILCNSVFDTFIQNIDIKIKKAIKAITSIPNSKNDPITHLLAPLPQNLDTLSFDHNSVPIVNDIVEFIKTQSHNLKDQVIDYLLPLESSLKSQTLIENYQSEAKSTLQKFTDSLLNISKNVIENVNNDVKKHKRQLMILYLLIQSLQNTIAIESNLMLIEPFQKLDYNQIEVILVESWSSTVIESCLKEVEFNWSISELDADSTRWNEYNKSDKNALIPNAPSKQLVQVLCTISRDVENMTLTISNSGRILEVILNQLLKSLVNIFNKNKSDDRREAFRKCFDLSFINMIMKFTNERKAEDQKLIIKDVIENTEEYIKDVDGVAYQSIKKFQIMFGVLITKTNIKNNNEISGKINNVLALGQPEKKVELHAMIVPTVDLKPRISLLAI